MRGKISEAEEDQYGFRPLDRAVSKKRLDLNDLLQRAKDQKKSDKKLNILIYSGAVSVVAVFVILLSL